MKIDGVSLKYTFDNAKAPPAAKTQFFDNNGSRGVYSDGWYACTFGPLFPWIPAQPGLDKWDSKKDVDGVEVAKGTVKRTVPAAFSASESFDVGLDMGAPVSLRYHEKAPFKFNGKIYTVKVDLQ